MLLTFGFFDDNDLFHFKHLLILGISLILVAVLTVIFIKKIKLTTFYRVLLIAAIASEAIKAVAYILANEEALGGYLPKGDLPLQLCSVQIVFIFILNLSNNEKLKRIVQGFMMPTCLIGGIGAMVVATNSSRSMWPITIAYFSYHILLSVFALYLLIKNELKFTIRDYTNTCLMFIAVVFFAIYANSILYLPPSAGQGAVNFMYVVDPPASGLPFLTEKYGWGVYFAHYLCAFYFLITVFYSREIIAYIRQVKKKKKQ